MIHIVGASVFKSAGDGCELSVEMSGYRSDVYNGTGFNPTDLQSK